MATLSLRAYSRHRGVALSAIQKAIKTARISTESDGGIDPEQADAAWEQNTRWRATPLVGHGPEEGKVSLFDSSQYAKARAMREFYQARLTELEYEKRAVGLVRRDEVEADAGEFFRQFRAHILRVPKRVTAMIAAETDEAKIYEILTTAIRMALNEFTHSGTEGVPF